MELSIILIYVVKMYVVFKDEVKSLNFKVHSRNILHFKNRNEDLDNIK